MNLFLIAIYHTSHVDPAQYTMARDLIHKREDVLIHTANSVVRDCDRHVAFPSLVVPTAGWGPFQATVSLGLIAANYEMNYANPFLFAPWTRRLAKLPIENNWASVNSPLCLSAVEPQLPT